MTEAFCLLGRQWIPVALSDGRRKFIRPSEITTHFDNAFPIRIDTGRPDCDIALTEVLIGIIAISLGLNTMDGGLWRKLYLSPPTPAELERAFSPFKEVFSLDGDGARFFQDKAELTGSATPIKALFIDAPAEHFSKPGHYVNLSRAGAALALLTLQTMAPAGGAGNRTSLRGGGPLTTLVTPPETDNPASLWQWLWLNTPADFNLADEDDEIPLASVFPWLADTRTSNPKDKGVATPPAAVHKAQAFFGLPRRIRLNFVPNTERLACDLAGLVDEIIVRDYIQRPWGTNYVHWSAGHPLSPYYRQKASDTEALPQHLQSTEAGYRQWAGLCVNTKDGLRRTASIVETFRNRRRADLAIALELPQPSCGLTLYGYVLDKMKPLDFGEAHMPLLAADDADVEKSLSGVASTLIEGADEIAALLRSNVRLALYGEGSEAGADSTQLRALTVRFWADTELDFYSALRDFCALSAHELTARLPELLEGWHKRLGRVALDLFDETAPLDEARQERIGGKDGQILIAGVEARRRLSRAIAGYGKSGQRLFKKLGLPPPSRERSPTGGTSDD